MPCVHIWRWCCCCCDVNQQEAIIYATCSRKGNEELWLACSACHTGIHPPKTDPSANGSHHVGEQWSCSALSQYCTIVWTLCHVHMQWMALRITLQVTLSKGLFSFSTSSFFYFFPPLLTLYTCFILFFNEDISVFVSQMSNKSRLTGNEHKWETKTFRCSFPEMVRFRWNSQSSIVIS